MQKFILDALIAILESIPNIKAVYGPYFLGSPDKFPAIIFAQDNFNNEFDSNGENHMTFQFKLWIVISANNKDLNSIGRDLMPKVSDVVIDTFNSAWNGGTYNGHRVWHRLSAGQNSISIDEKNKTAIQELTLVARLNVDIN